MIPEELMRDRNMIECNFIFGLFKNPEEITTYKHLQNEKDIITPDGIFYFGLALDMYAAGLRNFDSISILSYVSKSKELKYGYESRGGYNTVKEITDLLSADNLEGYYEELVKSNLLIHLHQAGFGILSEIEKLRKMSSEEIYDYYSYRLNDIALTKIGKTEAENISENYDSYIEEWDKGLAVGYKIGFPLLNWRFAGVHKGHMLLHEGHIGNGKTTTAILLYVLPVVESGEDVCIIANEQSVDEFRQMILASVLFNKIRYFKMNRHKFITGGFTPEDKAALKQAEEWLKSQKGTIYYISMQDYSLGMVEKVVRKYARIGCGMFLFDTMKPESDANDWGVFSDVAKQLFLLARNENVAIVATAQLSGESMGRKYLDLSCTGKAKAIAETASQVTMFRNLMADEREKLKPYRFSKDNNGKYTRIKQELEWDPEKDYIIMFTPKNRYGEIGPPIAYEINRGWNTMYEIGFVDVPYDLPYQRR
jgi:replicative DNA helicase